MSISIIQYCGKQNSRCGYCKGPDGSTGYGMHAFQLTPQDYQDLIDRGWRRCGHYCYKQDNKTTCCPCYTIKCNALEFKLGKSHKRILKRMNRFLHDGKNEKLMTNRIENIGDGEIDEDDHDNPDARECSMCNVNLMDEVQPPDIPLKDINLEAAETSANKSKEVVEKQQKQQEHQPNINVDDILMAEEFNQGENLINKNQKDINNISMPSKKAKQKRLERKLAKLASKGSSTSTTSIDDKSRKDKEKTLKDYIKDVRPDDKHKLKIVLVPIIKTTYTEEAFHLYCNYQLAIHKDNPEKLTPNRLQRFCYCSPLKLVNVHVTSPEFMATLDETYKLYEKYQITIHNDPPRNVENYLEFLQESPLKIVKDKNGPKMGYGTFHQQYWLDDKLIAIAVLDILPYCVSSVYFFYDPSYSFLSLGTYSSLREIEFVQQLAEQTPSLINYYMGFYIHSCPKMRYKAKLTPSYLLCSEVYTWHLITDELRLKLDARKYMRFNMDVNAKDANEFSNENIYEILLLMFEDTCTTYGDFVKRYGEDERSTLLEYGILVGKALTQRMLFVKTLST